MGYLIEVHSAQILHWRRNAWHNIFETGDHTSKLDHPLRDDDAVFREMTVQSVYELSALTDKQIPRPTVHTLRFLFTTFY